MPSFMELALCSLYIISVTIAAKVLRPRYKERSFIHKPQKPPMIYSSSVFMFRDYWSNRYNLKRNVKNEDKEIDTKGKTDGDFVVKVISDGKCTVQEPNKTEESFVDLVDPYGLVRQYEPSSIVVRVLSGQRVPGEDQLPHDPRWSRTTSGLSDVDMEPVVQSKSELTVVDQLVLPVAIAVAGLWIESIIVRFAVAMYPWIGALYMPIIVLLAIFFLSYVIWHFISEMTIEVKEARANIYLYNGEQPSEHYHNVGDAPDWLESKLYWVFRYMFIWPRELTIKKAFPFVHILKDQERIELWLDAKSGVLEWVVSDYHYRELWYEAESDLDRIFVWVYPNFHTLYPLNINVEGRGDLKDLYVQGHTLNNLWKNHVWKHNIFHPGRWIAYQIESGYIPYSKLNIIPDTLAGLWWDHWRYPHGADSTRYMTEKIPVSGVDSRYVEPGNLLGVIIETYWEPGVKTPKEILVKCQDGHERLCRIERPPQLFEILKISERIFAFEGDVVLVSPDDSQPDTKGNILNIYGGAFRTTRETELLIKEGLLPDDLVTLYHLIRYPSLNEKQKKEWDKAGQLFHFAQDTRDIKLLIKEGKTKEIDSKIDNIIKRLESAKEIYASLNERRWVAHSEVFIAEFLYGSGKYDSAIRHYRLAEEIYESLLMRRNTERVRNRIDLASKEIS